MKKGYCILIVSLSLLLFSTFIACNRPKKPGEEWEAPGDADDLKNPVKNNLLAEQKGKEVYNLYCLTCHGETGFGDGPAGTSFDRKPANFHRERIKAQSDGSFFWKITKGRLNMPAFKQILTEEQRWQVVSYIRKISVMEQPLRVPTALRNDIK